MNEEVVIPVSAGPISAPLDFGPEVVTLETSFGDVPPDYRLLVFCSTLVIALIVALVCVWRWIRNRHSIVVCTRCRIVLSAMSAALLFWSVLNLLLDLMLIVSCLAGAGPAGAGMRMLAYSQAMETFRYGFSGFIITGLLALIMGLSEPRAPAPTQGPVTRT